MAGRDGSFKVLLCPVDATGYVFSKSLGSGSLRGTCCVLWAVILFSLDEVVLFVSEGCDVCDCEFCSSLDSSVAANKSASLLSVTVSLLSFSTPVPRPLSLLSPLPFPFLALKKSVC